MHPELQNIKWPSSVWQHLWNLKMIRNLEETLRRYLHDGTSTAVARRVVIVFYETPDNKVGLALGAKSEAENEGMEEPG